MNKEKPITVTSPLLPSLQKFIPYLQRIWDSKMITNMGQFHMELEAALCEYLGVKYISLFTNGTIPLITALQALKIKGEVITTPYSFVATTHSLWWNGCKPVFVDIDPLTCNIDPDKIEDAITSETTAIMPVHVYGTPCSIDRIQTIANKFGLKVIYDAAHAFGVRKHGISILNAGDISVLSFHATKVFNTVEGGALVCHDADTKRQIDYLKNFGFEDETVVVGPGINGKMDELRAAYGLLNLEQVDNAIESRRNICEKYRNGLQNVHGISFITEQDDVQSNYAYFPIFIDAQIYGMTRDDLYKKLKQHNIYTRRYFYPLISTFSTYNHLSSATSGNLSVATKIADSVICLPLFHGLENIDIERIIFLIVN